MPHTGGRTCGGPVGRGVKIIATAGAEVRARTCSRSLECPGNLRGGDAPGPGGAGPWPSTLTPDRATPPRRAGSAPGRSLPGARRPRPARRLWPVARNQPACRPETRGTVRRPPRPRAGPRGGRCPSRRCGPAQYGWRPRGQRRAQAPGEEDVGCLPGRAGPAVPGPGARQSRGESRWGDVDRACSTSRSQRTWPGWIRRRCGSTNGKDCSNRRAARAGAAVTPPGTSAACRRYAR